MDEIERAVLAERERCLRIAMSRDIYGYVPDVGCFNCFERIANSIRRGDNVNPLEK